MISIYQIFQFTAALEQISRPIQYNLLASLRHKFASEWFRFIAARLIEFASGLFQFTALEMKFASGTFQFTTSLNYETRVQLILIYRSSDL